MFGSNADWYDTIFTKQFLRSSRRAFGHVFFTVCLICLASGVTPFISMTTYAIAQKNAVPLPDTQKTGVELNTSNSVKVRLRPGIGLRELSQKYLGNPDLWPVILRANGFRKIIDLAEDQELLVPTSANSISSLALASSLEKIQIATKSGAQLFAPKLIKSAVEFRDEALSFHRQGAYDESIDLSNKSIMVADTALEKSEANRNKEAEALLNDRQGWVEGQKLKENSWQDRPLHSILNEKEKIRTLSRSTAQIVFRDESRIRLNANSQVIILRLRMDPLKRKEEAQISMVEGDFYAVLAEESTRNKFKVNVKGVDASIESGNFWVGQSAEGAKFTNYDVKPVSISAQGVTLTLKRNEGAVINAGDAPTRKISVIGRISLLEPQDAATVFKNLVELSWESDVLANGYWLEIAFDQDFNRMRESLWGLKEGKSGELELGPGTYYWRVAALDKSGLPGQRSLIRKFEVQSDTAPPFLQIRTPEAGSFFRRPSVTISGESEAGSVVLIDGLQVDSDTTGRFAHIFEAREGANLVEIISRDSAGNETSKTVNFIYLKDDHAEVIYDADVPRESDGIFLTATDVLSLSGIAEKNASIRALDLSGNKRSTAVSDGNGNFTMNVQLNAKEETFELQITTQSGYSYAEKLSARKVTEPPSFQLSQPLPRITDTEVLEFTASVEPGSKVTMNDQRAEVNGNIALFSVKLIEGANLLKIATTNLVGLVTVEKWTVIYDRQAPSLVNHSISSEVIDGYTHYTIRLKAQDASGLSKTAKFSMGSGGRSFSGVLRYNRARKRYSGNIDIPENELSDSPVIMVELEDIAGNKTSVSLTQ